MTGISRNKPEEIQFICDSHRAGMNPDQIKDACNLKWKHTTRKRQSVCYVWHKYQHDPRYASEPAPASPASADLTPTSSAAAVAFIPYGSPPQQMYSPQQLQRPLHGSAQLFNLPHHRTQPRQQPPMVSSRPTNQPHHASHSIPRHHQALPVMMLSRPSPSGRNELSRLGLGGAGVRFTEPFDMNGWTVHYPPHGYGPPPGSRVLELYYPLEFAEGTFGEPDNDEMETLDARAAADDALEQANALEDSGVLEDVGAGAMDNAGALEYAGALADVDALLGYNSKRPSKAMSPKGNTPAPSAGPTQDPLNRSLLKIGSKVGPPSLPSALAPTQPGTPVQASSSSSKASTPTRGPQIIPTALMQIPTPAPPLPPTPMPNPFRAQSPLRSSFPPAGSWTPPPPEPFVPNPYFGARPSMGPRGTRRPAMPQRFEILSEVIDFALQVLPQPTAASPFVPSLGSSMFPSPTPSTGPDAPQPHPEITQPEGLKQKLTEADTSDEESQEKGLESQNKKRKLAETDNSAGESQEESSKIHKSSEGKDQEEWKQQQTSLSDRLDAEMLANATSDDRRDGHDESASGELPPMGTNESASMGDNDDGSFWDALEKKMSAKNGQPEDWEIDRADVEDMFE